MTENFTVISGKDNEQTNHTVTQWINHEEYKNMKYWNNNIALVKVCYSSLRKCCSAKIQMRDPEDTVKIIWCMMYCNTKNIL
jgi:uncharacterized membrane protein